MGRVTTHSVNDGLFNPYILEIYGLDIDSGFSLPKKHVSHVFHIWARGRYWGEAIPPGWRHMVIVLLADYMASALAMSFTNITLHGSSSTSTLIKDKVFLDHRTGEYHEALSFLMICVIK